MRLVWATFTVWLCVQAEIINIFIIDDNQFSISCPSQTVARSVAVQLVFNNNRSINIASCTVNPIICEGNIVYNASGFYVTLTVTSSEQLRNITWINCVYDGNILQQYKVSIVAKPTNSSCEVIKLTEPTKNVVITCKTTKVFPKAKCDFFSTNQNLITHGVIFYTHLETQTKPVYYYSECNWTSLLSNFESGIYSFNVSIYPDVDNGALNEVSVTPSTFLQLTLPQALLSKECYNKTVMGYTKPNTTIRCICYLDNIGYPPGNVSWFQSDDNEVGSATNSTATTLIVSPSLNTETFICKSLTELKNGVKSTVYNITYARGPSTCNVKINNTTQKTWDLCYGNSLTLKVSCNVELSNVVPGFKSIFYVNNLQISGVIESQFEYGIYTAQTSITITKAGITSVKCQAENSIFESERSECEQLMEIRDVPENPPNLSFRNDLNNLTSNLIERENYSIQCFVLGGITPVSNISVSCGNITESTQSGNIFTSPVTFTRNMTGQKCTCTAQHITGCYENNAANTIVKIMYPSTVNQFTIQTNTGLLNNGTIVKFACEGDGNPTPTMQIYKGNNLLYKNVSSMYINLVKTMSCLDTGIYTCQVDNGIHQYDTLLQQKAVFIPVLCPIQIQDDGNKKMIVSTVGQSLFFNLKIYGYPEPNGFSINKFDLLTNSSIQLQLQNLEISNYESQDQRINIQYSSLALPYGNIEISIFNLTQYDFTNYTLVIHQNGFQNLELNFFIQDRDENSASSNDDKTTAIVGGVLGSLAIIILVVVIVVVARKYKISITKRTARKHKKSDQYSELQVSQYHQSQHNYETPVLDSIQTHEHDREILSAVKLKYVNVEINKQSSSVSETSTSYCNSITTDVNPNLQSSNSYLDNGEGDPKVDHPYESIEDSV